jgi:hypothetical protein
MPPPTFQDLGLPPACTIRMLLVNESSKTLIVQFEMNDDRHYCGRLYARGFGERHYRELVPHADGLDIQDPLSCPVSPFVYFNRTIWKDRGGNWDGLYRVHCHTLEVERLVPSQVNRPTWISALLGITPDGSRLFVRTATQNPQPLTSTVAYAVATLDISSGIYTPLTDLPAVFV